MADTQRTLDAFVNASTGLFKDNVTNDMTCQRVRDFAVSAAVSYGSCYVSTMLETTVSADDTYYKLGANAGVTTAGDLYRFAHTSPGRLTYTGAPTIVAQISASLSVANQGPSGHNIGLALYRNGSAVTGATVRSVDPAPLLQRSLWTDLWSFNAVTPQTVRRTIAHFGSTPVTITGVKFIPHTYANNTQYTIGNTTNHLNLNLQDGGTDGAGTTEVAHIDFTTGVDATPNVPIAFYTGAGPAFTPYALASDHVLLISSEQVGSTSTGSNSVYPGMVVVTYQENLAWMSGPSSDRPYANNRAMTWQVQLATNDYIEMYVNKITPDAGDAAPRTHYVPEGSISVLGFMS